jgi:plasmid stability protein
MRFACDNVIHMSSVQIRNVPEQLHRELKVRAAQSGMTLSDYLLAEIRDLAVRPTMHQWLDEVSRREPVQTSLTSSEAIHLERERAPL